ncbi:chlorophyll a/b-binding protein domain-containing protein [Ochromonadaceae sp. CCMP2298]|nr:chlorophyll a/b-binding protein domain-containing protein [Ochromonadaceae sp. CCMP2298]
MFKNVLILSLLASVAAFMAPLNRVAKSSMRMEFANGLVGSDVEAPMFDPLSLSADASEETISWYRAAELKHARICMLASLGLSVQPVFHLPDAVFDSTLGFGVVTKLYAERPEAIWQILGALAAIETFSLFRDGQGEAGDLNFDPLNLKEKLGLNKDASKLEEMQLRELKNGRLAMLGTSALLIQEYVTGYGPYEQLMTHTL